MAPVVPANPAPPNDRPMPMHPFTNIRSGCVRPSAELVSINSAILLFFGCHTWHPFLTRSLRPLSEHEAAGVAASARPSASSGGLASGNVLQRAPWAPNSDRRSPAVPRFGRLRQGARPMVMWERAQFREQVPARRGMVRLVSC
eukprot:366472-Chlamydomonas_euryale.AAC.19